MTARCILVGLILTSAFSWAQTAALPYRPAAAEYSAALGRLVMISGSPNQLHIYDPLSRADTPVGLPLPPLSLSLSPDGLHAAVGHNALITYVNLSTASVERTFAIPANANVVVLTSSWIYTLNNSNGMGSVSVNIATGAVTANNSVFFSGLGRLNTSVNAIYGTRDGTSPNDIEKYDISTGPITAQTDSIYHGDFPVCGQVYFSPDGHRIYDSCGTVFWASTDPTIDMRYVTTLPGVTSMTSLTESAALAKIALLQGPLNSFQFNPPSDGIVSLYESGHLNPAGQFTLADFQAGAKSYAAHGRWIFFNSTSTALYVVKQADSSSGLLLDFAVETIPVSSAPFSCGAAFSAASVPAISAGTLGTVNITAPQSCQYQITSNVPWVQIVSGGYGSGNGTLTYMVRTNPSSSSRAGVLSAFGATFTITQDGAGAPDPLTRLPYNVVSAAYDKALDKLVLISAGPNELHLYDPVTQSDQSVPLIMPPLSVSIRPDGLYAAVGHDGWVSYVNLQTLAVTQVFQAITDVHAIILAGNGYIYLFPQRDWSDIFSLKIDTGLVTSTSAIYDGRVPRLSSDGNSLYVGGNWFSKWNISQGVAALNNNFFNSVSTCGNLWLTEDGNRMLTACGKVYRTSSIPSEDLQYNGQFSQVSSVVAADESALSQSTAVIPGGSSCCSTVTVDTQLQIYGDSFLGYVGSLPLPQFSVGSALFDGHGKFAFWNAAETKIVVIENADSTSKLVSSSGVFVIAPSTAASGCNFSLTKLLSVLPSGGGFDSLSVNTGASCVWTSTSNVPWITISAGSFGIGAGGVTISVSANPDPIQRTGTVTIAGQTLTVIVNTPGATPVISSITPNPVACGNYNRIWTINGNTFQNGAGLKVRVVTGGSSTDLTGSQVTFVSSTQLTISLNAGTSAAGWTALVFNPDGQASNAFEVTIAAAPASCALPQFTFGGGWYTALYFANPTDAPIHITVNFYANSGSPLVVPLAGIGSFSSRAVDLNPHSTVILEALNGNGNQVEGWAEVGLPIGATGYAVFRQVVPGRADQEAVVPLTPEDSQTADLTYDNTAYITSVAILNPTANQVTVTVTTFDENGVQNGTTQQVLGARAKLASTLQSLPGLSATANVRGRAVFTVNTGAVSVLALRFGGSAFTSIPVTHRPAVPVSTTVSYAVPQYIFGGAWYTALYFSNTTNGPLSVQTTFTTDAGLPLSAPLVGIGSVTSRTVNLAPGATATLEALDGGAGGQGWVEAAVPPGVTGYAVFRQVIPTRENQEAVVPLTSESSQAADLVYDETAHDTSVAFLNPSNQQATVTITVYNASGTQIGTAQVVLAARSKTATRLRDLPGLSGMLGNRGWASFSVTNGDVSVLGLRFGGEAFTSIPVLHR